MEPLCVSTPRALKSHARTPRYLQVFMVPTPFCLSRRLLGVHSDAGWGGGIDPLCVSTPRELKSHLGTSSTHPRLQARTSIGK